MIYLAGMSNLKFRKKHSDDLLSDLRRFDFKKYIYIWGFILFLYTIGILFNLQKNVTAYYIIAANCFLISMIVLITMIMEILKKYTATMAINELTRTVSKYGYILKDIEDDYKNAMVVRNLNDMYIFGDRYFLRFGLMGIGGCFAIAYDDILKASLREHSNQGTDGKKSVSLMESDVVFEIIKNRISQGIITVTVSKKYGKGIIKELEGRGIDVGAGYNVSYEMMLRNLKVQGLAGNRQELLCPVDNIGKFAEYISKEFRGRISGYTWWRRNNGKIGAKGCVIKNLYGPGGYDPADDDRICVLEIKDGTDIVNANKRYADFFEDWKKSADYDESLKPALWIDWNKETEVIKS